MILDICSNKQMSYEIIGFFNKYPNENSCKSVFKKCREAEGVICKKSHNKEHYWLKSKELYECKACGFRMSFKVELF